MHQSLHPSKKIYQVNNIPVKLSTQNVFYNCVDFNVMLNLMHDYYCIHRLSICKETQKEVKYTERRKQLQVSITMVLLFFVTICKKNKNIVFVHILVI